MKRTPTKPEDWIGRRFGRLLVESFHGKGKHNTRNYRCVCECGEFGIVRQDDLIRGIIASCRCENQSKILPPSRIILEQTNREFRRSESVGDCASWSDEELIAHLVEGYAFEELVEVGMIEATRRMWFELHGPELGQRYFRASLEGIACGHGLDTRVFNELRTEAKTDT